MQTARVRSLAADVPVGWAIKDSYAALDLVPVGFEVLFDATWLGLPAGHELVSGPLDMRWEAVSSLAGLAEWERAWRREQHAQALGSPRVFGPALLDDPAVSLLRAMLPSGETALVIANRSDDGSGPVVGVSNVVLPGPHPERDRASAVAEIQAAYPGMALVSYDAGDALLSMSDLGFEHLGPLRVWTRTSHTIDRCCGVTNPRDVTNK